MGIRASYLMTGGIMAVLGLVVARLLAGLLAAVTAGLAGVLLGALAFLLKALAVAGAAVAFWLVLRRAGRRRGEAAGGA